LEDATHVWKCHGEGADNVWFRSLDSLREWMDKHDTDPDLVDLLVSMLQAWRDEVTPTEAPYGLQLLLTRQLELGGQALIEGKLSYEWEACNQAYLNFIHSHQTGKRWVVQLIKRLWDIAWDLWDHSVGSQEWNTSYAKC
jgi:hypothetical protein